MTVAIAAVDGGAVAEAERQIRLILNPPTADVGQVYQGKVVNITKFGAFVNILPGRDGLVHISKLGGGKRIDSVESVLSLGDDIEVRVDDIDPNGKVSLSPTSALGGGDDPKAREVAPAAVSAGSSDDEYDAAPAEDAAPRQQVNFSDSYDEKVRALHGDLGPEVAGSPGRDRGDRGGRDRQRRPRRR